MLMKRLISYSFVFMMLLLCLPVSAQQQLTGVVIDAETGDAIPYASVAYQGHHVAVVSDANGHYCIARHEGWNITFSSVGYKPHIVAVKGSTKRKMEIKLKPDNRQLAEVKIKAKRQRYSRKNNPAVELMRKVIAAKKETDLGRILDGAASIIIFVPVYCAIVWRAYQYHAMEFRWLGLSDTPQHALAYGLTLFAIALFSGFVCHSGQCRLSDYYRQIHLFFLKGEKGSELSSSPLQQQRYNAMPWKGHLLEKLFQKTYVNYTLQQERSTPEFQRLKQSLTQTYGGVENMPQPLRDAFRRRSLPLMPLTNILTFNTRAITLYICCLIDLPWLYFLIETIVLSALCEYMRRRHERMSAELRLEFQIDS